MSDNQPTIESLQQSIKSLEDQVQLIQASLVKAGLMTVEAGITGVYEGEFMVTPEGQRYAVPANYASKTMLVSGDGLRMVEGVDGAQARFKQISKMDRLKAEGLLAKKDGKFEVLTDQGSFKVLVAAVNHYDGQPGDRVLIQYPRQHVKGSWAAIEKITKAQPGLGSPSVGPMVLPTNNAVQIKHAPVQAVAEPSSATSGEVNLVQAVASAAPEVQAKPDVASPAEPRSAKSNNERSTERPSNNRPAAKKPQGPKNTSNKPGVSGSNSARPAVKSNAKPRAAGNTMSRSDSGSKAVGPSRPQAKPVVEQSLPLDQGQIKPMVEYDDDELM